MMSHKFIKQSHYIALFEQHPSLEWTRQILYLFNGKDSKLNSKKQNTEYKFLKRKS